MLTLSLVSGIIFINDIFGVISEGRLFNYADDNTPLVSAKSTQETVAKLTHQCEKIVKWVDENEMKANQKKFQIMLSENTSDVVDLNDDVQLTCENHVKLLGVLIDQKLNFNEHVASLCAKAGRQINVLCRFKRLLSTSTKLLLYKSFILCHFNYCPLVWHSCGLSNTKRLERLQYRALHFVFNDMSASYEALLDRANMPTLELSRIRMLATEVYKATNNLSPSFICDLFNDAQPTHSYNLRNKNLKKNPCRTSKFGLNSFTHTAINIWNSLPNNIRTTTDFHVFKRFIRSWNGPQCKCAFCNS
jgi:hypothetical protein